MPFPNSPKLTKAGIVLLNPDTGAVERVIALQYNPETLTRTLQVQSKRSYPVLTFVGVDFNRDGVGNLPEGSWKITWR